MNFFLGHRYYIEICNMFSYEKIPTCKCKKFRGMIFLQKCVEPCILCSKISSEPLNPRKGMTPFDSKGTRHQKNRRTETNKQSRRVPGPNSYGIIIMLEEEPL